MKKLLMTMLAVLSCGATYALPLMNPSEASLLCDGVFWEGHCGDLCDPCLTWCDAFSVRFGFYGDYEFNRYMIVDGSNSSRAAVDVTSIYTNAAYFAANFWDRFDLFWTLGTSNFSLDADASVFNGTGATGNTPGTSRISLIGDEDFSWSIGARGTIWECGCTSFGIEFQWFQFRQKIKSLIQDATTTASPTKTSTVLTYQDWQIGLGVSHRINLLVPYIGLTFGTAQAKFGDTLLRASSNGDLFRLNSLKSDKVVGFAVGTSLVDCEKMSLTAEVDLARETAAFVNGQFRF